MSRPGPVGCQDRPTVFGDFDAIGTQGRHWFNRDRHASRQPRTGVGPPVIGDVRVFVQVVTNAVTDQIADDTVAEFIEHRLDGRADIAGPNAVVDGINPGVH